MTEQEVKDKVRAVLRLMKLEWTSAAWDDGAGNGGAWWCYAGKPWQLVNPQMWRGPQPINLYNFDLPPFSGDWRDSLVEREE